MCELVGFEYNKNSDIGLSLQQSTKFFDKFNLSLIAVDILGNKIFEHRNESSRHIKPSTLYTLVHSNHIYNLSSIKSCTQYKFRAILKISIMT